MTPRLGLGRFLAVVAATVCLCVAGAVALPHDPYIRYQAFKGTIFERLDWIYERIHFDETPIDVALIGSSRTVRGAVSPLIEDALAARAQPLRVANLSMPAAGFDVRYSKARALLAAKPDLKLLVISVVEVFPRDGHQAFADLGTVREVLSSPWIINRKLPTDLARLPMRQIELFMASQAPEAYGYRATFDPTAYDGPRVDPRVFAERQAGRKAPVPTDPVAHAEAMAKDSKWRKRGIRPAVLPASLGWAEFGVSRSYVKRMSALAESNGVKLAFLHLPFYDGFEAPVETEWLSQFGPVWIASHLKEDPMNYADVAHASDEAGAHLAVWVADRILETLDLAP